MNRRSGRFPDPDRALETSNTDDEFDDFDSLLGGFQGCDARSLKIIIDRVVEIERLLGEEEALRALRKAALQLIQSPPDKLDS